MIVTHVEGSCIDVKHSPHFFPFGHVDYIRDQGYRSRFNVVGQVKIVWGDLYSSRLKTRKAPASHFLVIWFYL